jgi:PIN domain nuclease of toxin-antitoxin system
MTYLDTHIAAQLCQGDTRRLSREAKRVIEADNDIRISPMVVLEFEYLREIQKIKMRPEQIVQGLAEDLGVRVCEVPFSQVALQALEESWTRDAFDRIIVAQARMQKAKLISRDINVQRQYKLALD